MHQSENSQSSHHIQASSVYWPPTMQKQGKRSARIGGEQVFRVDRVSNAQKDQRTCSLSWACRDSTFSMRLSALAAGRYTVRMTLSEASA